MIRIPMLPPIVTSKEGLDECIRKRISVFCIEEPLFSAVKKDIASDPKYREYNPEVHGEKHYILMYRNCQPNRYDCRKIRLSYIPPSGRSE